MNSEITFISNNVKGIQNSVKRIKLFEYLKSYVTGNGFIFLQETHPCINDEIMWREEFNGELFFSHGKTNSCGVAIGFYGSKTIEQINKISDKSGRVLLVEATVDDTVFVLINIYNTNTESEQLETLLDLVSIIDKVKDIQSKNIVLGGDFNVIFDISFESLGGNPCLKKKSIAKLIQIKEKFDLCDIWRIRNSKIKRFTFRQQHLSGFIQRRLDYFFLSNLLRESVNKTDILAALSTDHSRLLFSLKLRTDENRGKGLWKFNNSLSMNSDFQTKMKFHIKCTLETLEIEGINDLQVRWEFLKYEIRKFSIEFSKLQAQNMKKEKMFLENKLKKLENNTKCIENLEYIDCRNKLDKIYEQKINSIRIRSKCDWYEHGEKSSKFFLNLEKTRSTQCKIRNITKDKKNLTCHKKINQELFDF